MKLSCWIEHAPVGTLSHRAAFLARAGFDAFEIFLTPEELVAHRGELQEIVASGTIGVSAIGPIHHGWLIDPDPELRKAAREAIALTLEIAADLGGVPVIVIPILGYTRALPGGLTTGRSAPEDTAILVEGLGDLGQKAERLGTILLLEAINRYESPIVNGIAEGVAVVRAVNNAHLRLAVDSFHMNIEEVDLPASLRVAAPVLGHFHLADSDRSLPGRGHTDFLTLFRVLAECGYSRYVTVEAMEPQHDPTRTLPFVARYLRSLIEVASDQRPQD